MVAPTVAVIGRTVSQKDGGFRVYVRFIWKDTDPIYADLPPGPVNRIYWRGAAIVKSENGRFVVDDILLFKNNSAEIESRLSHILKENCDGPRWVGRWE